MNDLQGKKFYILFEIDKDLDQYDDVISVTSYDTLESARRELSLRYNQVISALKDKGKSVNFFDFQEGFAADVETDDNRWHWEIQTQVIQ